MIRDKVDEGSPEFFRRLNQKFPAYLKNDQTSQQCKKSHHNYPRLARNVKKTFEWQIRPVMNLLKVEKENITTYRDLCRAAYLRDELKLTLKNQTDAMVTGSRLNTTDHMIRVVDSSERTCGAAVIFTTSCLVSLAFMPRSIC